MDDEIKRWTAKRKTALVMDIITLDFQLMNARSLHWPQPIRLSDP